MRPCSARRPAPRSPPSLPPRIKSASPASKATKATPAPTAASSPWFATARASSAIPVGHRAAAADEPQSQAKQAASVHGTSLPRVLCHVMIGVSPRCVVGGLMNKHVAWEEGAGLFNRRELLRVGAISLAGCLVPKALAKARPVAAAPRATARSVIVLWMAGGVTHIDSFDPKPDASEEIRGTLTSIQTTLPGVRFSEVMPCLARLTDKIAVLR